MLSLLGWAPCFHFQALTNTQSEPGALGRTRAHRAPSSASCPALLRVLPRSLLLDLRPQARFR